MNILVACSEIGSASALKQILIDKKINQFFFTGTELAKNFFKSCKDFKILPYNGEKELEAIYLGSTLGPSAERDIYLNDSLKGIKKIAVIDSYWNVSQRFADENSGVKWAYVPNKIFIPNHILEKKLINEGFYGEIEIFKSESFTNANELKKDKDEIRKKYNVKDGQKVFIFISEYSQKIPSSWEIEVDQFNYEEIHYSISMFLEHVNYLNSLEDNVVPFIKWHPTLLDKQNLKKKLPSINCLETISKDELFSLGDVFFGLNSMLFLEATRKGFPAVSLMSDKMMKKNNLSNYVDEIISTNKIEFRL